MIKPSYTVVAWQDSRIITIRQWPPVRNTWQRFNSKEKTMKICLPPVLIRKRSRSLAAISIRASGVAIAFLMIPKPWVDWTECFMASLTWISNSAEAPVHRIKSRSKPTILHQTCLSISKGAYPTIRLIWKKLRPLTTALSSNSRKMIETKYWTK